MEQQADKFRQQKKHNSLLLVAASRGYLADAEALVELGAELGCKDKKGRSPLHFAAARGRTEVARFLLSRGAEVDAETPDGRTPLHLAALDGHAETATLLLQKGAWAEAYDSQDNTPLHLAAGAGHTGAMEVLARHGAKASLCNKQGLTPMGCALLGGHMAAAKLLQGWGASLLERPHGYGLLHLAAGLAQPASLTFLLDGGADANDCSNPEGATPLHSAALGGCARCAELLLRAGADRGLADADGRVPADLAPPEDAHLRELLAPEAAHAKVRAQRSAARGSEAPAAPLSPHEQFQALPEAERRSKVERWALLDAADLAAALAQYPTDAAAEASARVTALQATRKLLNIHKALAALHADDDFQGDIPQPHVRAAIDAIRADTSLYERHAADPVVLGVLQKMRRLHSVAQANGQRTVSIDDMIAQAGQAEKDAERQLAIEATCTAHVAAAAAAAAASAPAGAAKEAAHAAYVAALQAAKAAAPSGSKAGSSGGSSSAAGGGPAASTLRQRLAGGRAGGGAGARAEAAAAEAQVAEGQAGDDDPDLPQWLRGGFSWKKVWAEFSRQTKMALAMLAAFMLLSWALLGLLNADVVCFQETKLRRGDLDAELCCVDGWVSFFCCDTTSATGYSGTATYCRAVAAMPFDAQLGFTGCAPLAAGSAGGAGAAAAAAASVAPHPALADRFSVEELTELDAEGRICVTDHGSLVLFNIYGPAITSGDEERAGERLRYKMRFYEALELVWRHLRRQGRAVMVVGDANICPAPIDHPAPDPAVDFYRASRPERLWLRRLLSRDGPGLAGSQAGSGGSGNDSGSGGHAGSCLFVDTFRHFHPTRQRAATCWSTATNARVNNWGSRIDLRQQQQQQTDQQSDQQQLQSAQRGAADAAASPDCAAAAAAAAAEAEEAAARAARAEQSKAAWAGIMQKNKPPLCQHGEPAALLKVNKTGPNKGRYFYTCARAEGPPPEGKCKLFKWVEQRAGDHRLTTLGKQAPAGGGGGKNGGPAGKKVKT
ncbi:DNA-(apurinic or apyrimidinic site) lyase 2 [Micractinium conductrix]|uniref:DNA-(apurinic or apyrimidinic site) endonuclease 2 n=1 Tax=Micractinium conductrix TaxID=554055 RepID=A0A2P6V7J5_9CHLO|nr:DNA-(apurinic or apyrimidinic site) lyase 2 [Micractinium conductrix]|eukprot:PSC70051.1 DNA-(apurinic or apyrimidinic site) lyase 2 [Micractinium conductrix]